MLEQRKSKKIIGEIIFFVVLVAIDQVTKNIVTINGVNLTVIPNILELQMARNTGGAFGVGEGNTTMFIITNLVVLGLIIRFISLQYNLMDKKTLYTLIAILAGGIGNVIDRLIRGYVVDFINIFPNINFPRFNFADMYITIGWVILAFIFALYTHKEIVKNKKK